MDEDVFPIENGDFPNVMLVFRGVCRKSPTPQLGTFWIVLDWTQRSQGLQ